MLATLPTRGDSRRAGGRRDAYGHGCLAARLTQGAPAGLRQSAAPSRRTRWGRMRLPGSW
jgi:hypothetical protein